MANSGCDTHEGNRGLLGNGTSGAWDVSIDEATSGDERWFAAIEGPADCLDFELPSLDIIPQVIRFLTPVTEPTDARADSCRGRCELLVSEPTQLPALVVRDDEFDDRSFVVVGQIDRPTLRCTLTADEMHDILEALRQAESDHPQTRPNSPRA
jgi:hypothetical protein